jgi:hypothetical protein
MAGLTNPYLLTGTLEVHGAVGYIVSGVILSVQLGVIASVSLKIYNISMFVYAGIYSAVSQYLFYFIGINEMVLGTLIPFVLILLVSVKYKRVKQTIMTHVKFMVIFISYAFVSFIVRTGSFYLYNRVTLYEGTILGIDVLFLFILLYLVEVTKDGPDMVGIQQFGERLDIDYASDPVRYQSVLEYQRAVGVERVVSRIIGFGLQCIQIAIVLFGCALIGLLPEGAVIIISFSVIGLIITRRWHPQSKTYIGGYFKCILTSALIFMPAIYILPSLYYSWYLLIVAGFGLCYAMYTVQIHQDISSKKDAIIAKFKEKLPFRCATATSDEIRARCLEKGKDDRYANFMVAVYRSGRLHKDIGDEFGFSEGTVNEYKRKRTKELES